MKLNMLARKAHYIDHLAPVWKAIPSERRGLFYVDKPNIEYAIHELGADGVTLFDGKIIKGEAVLTCGYSDLLPAGNIKRITMEHGIGHAFTSNAYPNGRGKREGVDLALLPNEYTERLARSVRPNALTAVIGTPKTDTLANRYGVRPSDEPTVAIAFHWGSKDSDPPESGNALDHYRDILPELGKRYRVIGHGHPLAEAEFREVFDKAGIEYVGSFREVCRRADVYVNDLSSTMYEFLTTGKPVIVLNAPQFRREAQWGIRFWDYSDVGINVEQPDELFAAIDRTLAEYQTVHIQERMKAVRDLYPYLGTSAERAAKVLCDYMDTVA